MKQLLAICALAVSFNTYSSCTDDFNTGITQYDLGMSYFEQGNQSYQEAVDESRGQGRRSVICNALLKSNTGFDVATNSFNGCTTSFDNASTSCTGRSSDIALANKGVCVENYSIAKGNYQQILSTLKTTCFKASKGSEIILDTEVIQAL